jgi:hypothetical protein
MFEYEHSSRYNATETRDLLLKEIDDDDFNMSPMQGRIMLNDFEKIIRENPGMDTGYFENEFIKAVDEEFHERIHEMFTELKSFIYTEPKLPDAGKEYSSAEYPVITTEDTREKIITKIVRSSKKSESAMLALYVYRDMELIDWLPFIKAAMERNPVSFNDLNNKDISSVFDLLREMPDDSIYDDKRLALPDEVWNFRKGDGIEKAILLADFLHHKNNSGEIIINSSNKKVTLNYEGKNYSFTSHKSFNIMIRISGKEYVINALSKPEV